MVNWKFWKRSGPDEVCPPPVAPVLPPPRAVEVLTPESALTVSAAYRAVDYLGSQVGMLTLVPKRLNTAEGRFMVWTDTPLWRLLAVRPSARLTPYVLWKSVVSQVLLYGNSVVVPQRGRDGELTGLVLTDPRCVGYDPMTDTYTINDLQAGLQGQWPGGRVLHFKNLSLDGGLTGVSTLTYARRVLSIAATSDREQLERVETGGKYKAVLTNAEVADPEGTRGFGHYDDRELRALAGELSDRLNSGQSVVAVPGDGRLTPLSMTSTDLQFLESRKFSVSDVARFFGVPPAKLMDTTGAVYKSAESATNAFYVDTLAPLLTMIEEELRAKLVPAALYGRRRFEFDLSRLQSMDPSTRARFEAQQLINGVLTVNELRKAYGRPRVEGGDRLRLSSTLAELDGENDEQPDGADGEDEANGTSE